MLQHRELNIKYAPSFWSKKTVRQLISSNNDLYGERYTKSLIGNISAENGCIYFNHFEIFCTLNSINKDNSESPPFFVVENSKGQAICRRIYHGGNSSSLLSITEKGFLCEHSAINGKLMNAVYIKKIKYMSYDNLEWNLYGKSFSFIGGTLTANQCKLEKIKYLVVLTFPMEFYTFMEIKDAVFGEDVKSLKLCNQLLTVMYSTCVAVYQFDEFLREGKHNFSDISIII